ncbi:MAG TPA: metalloregulator ArsR/SmtB family transcription factor [Candidatus Syntrophosphaera sp.]|nr:metalloregulator ArsR/SmtB family transcription factor [Candidatus Syntrophosphaera sp.]
MTAKCLCKSVPDAEMRKINKGLPESETIDYLSDFFRVFGDSTRLRILYFLSRHEFCVADLAILTGMQQSAVSHQLKILRLHRLVRSRRDGTTIYYALDDLHVQKVFDIALEHVKESFK